MEYVQNLSAGMSTALPAMSALAAPDTSTETIKADPEGCDLAGNADSADQAVPHRAGTLSSDKLARIFMRSKNMDLESGTRSLISDCKTDWLSRTLISHNAVVPAQAEKLLTATQGDMTEAFVLAAAMGDSCTASAFFEAGADTVQAAKGFIDRGEWDAVKLIIKDRLFRISEGNGGISDVIAYALESNNVPSMDWLKWLCDDVGPNAGALVAAHFARKRDLAGLMEMARSQSISSAPLMEAVVNMQGLSREERIRAIRKIVATEQVPDHGLRASEDAVYEQLVQGNLEATELMIASGVRWNHALFIAAARDDVSTIRNLFKCDGIQLDAVVNALFYQSSSDGKSAIAYSIIQHYVLEIDSSPWLKVRELERLFAMNWLFRAAADAVLRHEIQAGNTHAVAIFMTAGGRLSSINALEELADPMRTTGAQQQIDAHSNPSKQFV